MTPPADSPGTPPRVLPTTDERSAFFWTSGRDGRLRVLRCEDCSHVIHPPVDYCPACQSRRAAPAVVSGRGTLYSFTVNHQPWDGVGDVYVIGLVALDEQPDVRLVTDVVGVDPADVRIGMPVEVHVRRPRPGVPADVPARRLVTTTPIRAVDLRHRPVGGGPPARPRRPGPDHRRGARGHRGRRPRPRPTSTGSPPTRAAVGGARGLLRARLARRPGRAAAAAGPGTAAGSEGPAQLAAVVNAAMAVSTGLAPPRPRLPDGDRVHRPRARGRRPAMGRRHQRPRIGRRHAVDSLPFRAQSAANHLAMYAQRHMHEFGTTPEQMAQIALNARRNAARNPKAVFTDPLTLDDYLAVPDDHLAVPAVRLRRPRRRLDRAGRLRPRARRATVAPRRSPSRPSGRPCAGGRRGSCGTTSRPCRRGRRRAHMWSRTDLTPGGRRRRPALRRVQLLAMSWLEALGFCGHGESGPFIEGGTRIALDGELPLNTAGGQLSGGRLHGYGFLHEAVLQLRGRGRRPAGRRQPGGGGRRQRRRPDRRVPAAHPRDLTGPRRPLNKGAGRLAAVWLQ